MEILTGGSFVNLDNREKISQLAFTARVMAETAVETEGFVNEADNNRQIADDIWHGAEYMCREHEAQQVKNIFVNNFLDRLKELKTNETTQPATTIEETVEAENSNEQPQEINFQNENDEFLGFVAASESKVEAQTMDGGDNEFVNAIISREQDAPNVSAISVKTNVSSESNASAPTLEANAPDFQSVEPSENAVTEQPDDSTIKATAQDESGEVQKTSETVLPAPALEIEVIKLPEKEPYQFDKCTVTTTIQLLPVEADYKRRAVVSVRTHDFAPQIWTLRFPCETGLDALLPFVNEALSHYQRELPVKVMNKMRKEKLAGKKSVPATQKSVGTNQPNVSAKAAQSSSTRNESTTTKTAPPKTETQQSLEISQQNANGAGLTKSSANAVVAAQSATKTVQKADTAQGSLF